MKKSIFSFFVILCTISLHSQMQASNDFSLAPANSQQEPTLRKKIKFHWYGFPRLTDTAKDPKLKEQPTSDKTYIDFVGSGDIQKAVSNGQQLNANTGAGIIFERYRSTKTFFQSLEIEADINIASTSDTVTGKYTGTGTNYTLTNGRDFGTYLLNPVSGKQAFYQNTNLYFGYPDCWLGSITKIVSGLNMRYVASNNIWQYNLTGNAADNASINLGAYLLRMGVFHEFIPDDVRLDQKTQRAKYSLFFGLNYSMRGLLGDIGNDKNIDLRKHFLGTDKTSFQGFELNMGFRLNNLRFEFSMPALSKGQQVPGLTNGQFLFSIRFIGGFGLEINTPASGVTPDKAH